MAWLFYHPSFMLILACIYGCRATTYLISRDVVYSLPYEFLAVACRFYIYITSWPM